MPLCILKSDKISKKHEFEKMAFKNIYTAVESGKEVMEKKYLYLFHVFQDFKFHTNAFKCVQCTFLWPIFMKKEDLSNTNEKDSACKKLPFLALILNKSLH